MQLQGIKLSVFMKDWIYFESILGMPYRPKTIYMLVADRLRLLSISSPKAEKGQFIYDAILLIISQLKKLREVSCASNFIFIFLSCGNYLIPYSQRQTLHTLAQMQSTFSSINYTYWFIQRLLAIPPMRQIFQLMYRAQKLQAAWGVNSIACHQRVQTLRQSIVSQNLTTVPSLQIYPPTNMMYGLQRPASTPTGEPLIFLSLVSLPVDSIQSYKVLFLKSENLNEQTLFSLTTCLVYLVKTQPVNRNPLPHFQKMTGLREAVNSGLTLICVHSIVEQSRICQSFKNYFPLLPPIMIRYLALKKQEAWYSLAAGILPLCQTAMKESPVNLSMLLVQIDVLRFYWYGPEPPQRQIELLQAKREKPCSLSAFLVGTGSMSIVQQSSFIVVVLYQFWALTPPRMSMWCSSEMMRCPILAQLSFLTGQYMLRILLSSLSTVGSKLTFIQYIIANSYKQ